MCLSGKENVFRAEIAWPGVWRPGFHSREGAHNYAGFNFFSQHISSVSATKKGNPSIRRSGFSSIDAPGRTRAATSGPSSGVQTKAVAD
ncbi:hypothetical protein AVEN_141367-1 [Araneus ventricosus]|uniref:Uncharacterized protein n=1 Tax=Araneus ventricosus TaxID=182803 RepID=A0A4Y2D1K0_ARAVE|nr:hypothetical protein AVEN_141367-1 [Araneus ventricosus]